MEDASWVDKLQLTLSQIQCLECYKLRRFAQYSDRPEEIGFKLVAEISWFSASPVLLMANRWNAAHTVQIIVDSVKVA